MIEEEEDLQSPEAPGMKKKRSRRRRKPRSAKNTKVQPVEKHTAKKHHDAPMTKRDLYFALHCELVSIGHGAPAVARVTMINWDAEVVLDTFVQVPVPVTDFRGTGISSEVISTCNPQAMSFAKVRQSVHQILKGKILVGYRLQEHLTALGLTHPPRDVRDAAYFRLFQYEEVDEVTEETVVVERRLPDLAADFLQREISIPPSPMDACTAALDLYKAYRRDWEEFLVRQAHENENQNYYSPGPALTAGPNISPSVLQPRTRLPGYDESMITYVGSASPTPERGSSWFSLGRSKQPFQASQQAPVPMRPGLTSEALEMHDYGRYGADPTAYASHHPYYVYADYTYTSSSNPGSSTYYEDSSVFSDSYASESVASSLHEEGQQVSIEPVQQTASSWFRFGSRKTRYPQQLPKEPMSSLAEEPDDAPVRSDPVTSVDDVQADETQSEDMPLKLEDIGDNDCEVDKQTNDDDKQSSSWFSFRRPKSPRLGKKQDDSGDERDSTPARRRRGSLGSNPMCDSIRSAGQQSSSGSVGQRNSVEQEVALPEVEELEKQPSSWFSFRRASKSTGKRRSSLGNTKEDSANSSEQPSLQTDPTEAAEEDWMREVLGSPNTEQKELLAVAWPEGTAMGLEAQMVSSEPPQQPPKESKWLPRFLRSSKTPANDMLPRADDLESSSRYQWSDQLASTVPVNHSKMLNPSFFSQAGHVDGPQFSDQVAGGDVIFSARSRLETESTLPTVASEAEDDTSGETLDDSVRDFEGGIEMRDFERGMEMNFSYLNL